MTPIIRQIERKKKNNKLRRSDKYRRRHPGWNADIWHWTRRNDRPLSKGKPYKQNLWNKEAKWNKTTFNIAGFKFVTSKQTLSKKPYSLLNHIITDIEGGILIDRSAFLT